MFLGLIRRYDWEIQSTYGLGSFEDGVCPSNVNFNDTNDNNPLELGTLYFQTNPYIYIYVYVYRAGIL